MSLILLVHIDYSYEVKTLYEKNKELLTSRNFMCQDSIVNKYKVLLLINLLHRQLAAYT